MSHPLYATPQWRKFRFQALERAQWRCQICGTSQSSLHVHHKRYIPHRLPWQYNSDQIEVLCAFHHRARHYKTRRDPNQMELDLTLEAQDC